MKKEINHIEYMKKVRRLSLAELRYIIDDASKAAKALPGGENEGYYLDEVNYCTSEINRRKKGLDKI